jgi:hypothetical protein
LSTKQKKRQLSAFEEEILKSYKKVMEYKVICEANIVSLLWKNTELFHTYSLVLEDFTENMWKVFWQIAYDIVVKEGKELDEITTEFYLEKHPKLKAKYDNYGGYEKIIATSEYVKESNMESYVDEIHKWNAVLKLIKKKFPVYNKISEFVDMSAEDIYDEYEAILNDIFINIEGDVKSYAIADGIYDLIEELDKGNALGMPYHNMKMITRETGGQYLGSITLVGGLSNVGKSTFARNTTIPSCLEHDEPLVIMINEEGKKKWQRELIVWVANNIYKNDLQKYTVRDGKYSKEVKDLIYECAKWIEDKDKEKKIRIIPFQKYKTSLACKTISKYASLGVKHFILDTFKADAGKTDANTWLIAQQAMVDINDIVKPEAKNLHILITFQLGKGSAKQRYYTQDNIGVFKNIVDPASTCIMIRDLMNDEYDDEPRKLKVCRLEGKYGRTEIPVKLNKDKRYQIIFIVKNREGSANSYQIVCEHDLSRNLLKEIGICHCPIDF